MYFDEIFGAYGILPFDWQEVDGEIVYGGLREDIVEPLQLLADWYKEGLVHPDFISGLETPDLYTSGQVGFLTDSSYQDPKQTSSRISTLKAKTPTAEEVYAAPPKGPDGLRGGRLWGLACHVVSFGNNEGYGVKVPRMLQMFEGMFTDDALMTEVRLGKEGVQYKKVDAATTTNKYSFESIGEWTEGQKPRMAGFKPQFNMPSFFVPFAPSNELYQSMLSDAFKNWVDAYTSEDAVLHDVFFKVDVIPSAADYLDDVRTRQMKLMSDVIQGTMTADQYVEEFTKVWNNGGGDVMLEEAREHKNVIEQIYKEIGIK